jgi:hypothetical protein
MKLNLDKAKNYTLVFKYDDFFFSEHDSITLEKIKAAEIASSGNCETRLFDFIKAKKIFVCRFQITTILLLLQRLKQSWKQYNCDYRKDYVRLKGSLPAAFIYQYKVLLLMKVLNLTKLFMIMWDKVQETVQFIKAKN